MKIYTKEEWAKMQYTGRWNDCPYNRSRVEAGELHPYYIGRRNLMVNDGTGTSLLTEGIHFLIDGDYENLPILHKSNAKEGAAYQFGSSYQIVQRIYRIDEKRAQEQNLMYLDRVQTSVGDFALPGSNTCQIKN